MNVFLIIDETNFYQPNFVSELLQSSHYNFVGCALAIKIPKKNNIEKYMLRNFYYLRWNELLKLSYRKLKYSLYGQFGIGKPKMFYSVKSVLKHYDIPYFKVKNDINKKVYLERIKEYAPDVILSSNSLYFKKELLSLAKYCINRHSSLLPSYGGLWPVFQALRNNEQKVGVTVHIMSNKIDKGAILAQKEIEVQKYDTVDSLYQQCFKISAEVCIDALNVLDNNSKKQQLTSTAKKIDSYFSFPTKEQWKEFRERSKKFI